MSSNGGTVGRPWPKGVSGNPGGKRRMPPEVREAMVAATPSAVVRLIQLVSSADERVALDASKTLLDRVYGKSGQPLIEDADNNLQLRELTREQLEALAADGPH